ncbi:MAG: hypothetical protein ACRC4W_06050 [Treponemataceae bacterium]
MPKSNQQPPRFFKDFVTDEKLLQILNIIEGELGYQITAEPMPKEHAKAAAASMSPNNNKFTFLYIPEKPLIQATLCHELMHVVLCYEGFPCFQPILFLNNAQHGCLSMLCNLFLHIEVWQMTKELGFDESPFYSLSPLMEYTKKMFRDENLFSPNIIPTSTILTLYLLQFVLSPALQKEKDALLLFVQENNIHVYKNLVSTVDLFLKYPPNSPQACKTLASLTIQHAGLQPHCLTCIETALEAKNLRQMIFQ